MSASIISAKQVMELRERTGSGLMECKKALLEATGDIELAIQHMREAGKAKADKKASRVAAEGMIAVAHSADKKTAYMIELNSETDFVAKDSNFTEFGQQLVQVALANKTQDIAALQTQSFPGGSHTVEETRQALVAKLGENIQIRRMQVLHAPGVVGAYTHGSKIGVLVALDIDNAELAKDIAMHIAAANPLVLSPADIDQALIENERAIFMAQAKESGKPQEIIEKMVEGRIRKYVDEVSLIGQPFVKNPEKTVGQLLKESKAQVLAFVRFAVGEGIEKKEDNFVAEVMAQVQGS